MNKHLLAKSVRNFIAIVILSYILFWMQHLKKVHTKNIGVPFLWAVLAQQQPWSIFFLCFDMLSDRRPLMAKPTYYKNGLSCRYNNLVQLSHLKYAFYSNRACIFYGCWQIFRSMFILPNNGKTCNLYFELKLMINDFWI